MAILPAIPTPVADLGALTVTATALKLRVEALHSQVTSALPVTLIGYQTTAAANDAMAAEQAARIAGDDAVTASIPLASDELPLVDGVASAGVATAWARDDHVHPVTALTWQAFAALDLSGLPTSNPGGGKPWLSAGVLHVGP
jgi:hypothetical protein